MPFRFEGQRRLQQAVEGLARFDVDKLVTVRLDDLLLMLQRGTSLRKAFEVADVEVAKIGVNRNGIKIAIIHCIKGV